MLKRLTILALFLVATAGLVLRCGKQNQKPVFDSVTWPDSVYLGASATFSCAVSDPEGDSVSVSWYCNMGSLSAPTGTSVNWQAPDSACNPVITVRATDTHDGETKREHTVVVSAATNRPPQIASVSGPDSVEAGGNCELTCNASDPDGDTLGYTWSCNVGGLSGTSGRTVTWYAPDSAVAAVVTVVATDSSLADTASISIGVKPIANRPPVVDSISGPGSVPANGNTSLTCFASDPDGDSLTYSWTCARGRVSPATGRTVTWYAPDTSGNVIITATVRDGRGGEDVRGKTISVSKVTTTWLDTMVSVPAASYKAWYGTMKVGYNVWGNFSVSQDAPRFLQDINFYVFDSTNYFKWVNNQSSSGIVVISRSAGTSYSATIPRTCRYYVVLDNTFSVFTPKIVTVLTKLTSP
jgi:surface antigen